VSRRVALLACSTLVLATAPALVGLTATTASAATKVPVITVIDTGVRATHQEFDYQGQASTTDQFVGWWDFTAERKPAVVLPTVGQTWDTTIADPYDGNGHGTATSSMAVGLNKSAAKDPSLSPGGKLAFAKVGTADGTISGDIAAATRWAVDTIHTDVISISIGSIVPLPSALAAAEYDAISYARSKGVLVVVSNGNGFANAGIPGDPGWASSYASSTDVLAVGASGLDGFTVHTDPEVTGKFYDVGMADFSSDTGYVREAGTSFSAPFVAGGALKLIAAARAAGKDDSAGRIETLIKQTALDSAAVPPTFEGYGEVTAATIATATGFASSGGSPTRPSPDLSAIYVEQVIGAARGVWSNTLR
jgi:hypothetical protein